MAMSPFLGRLGPLQFYRQWFPTSIKPTPFSNDPPYSSICRICAEAPDGRMFPSTGWIAAPGVVITAGHSVHHAVFGPNRTPITIRVGVGWQQGYTPQEQPASIIAVHPTYVAHELGDFDVSVLAIQNRHATPLPIPCVVADDATLEQTGLILGYPREIDGHPVADGTLCFSEGKLNPQGIALLYRIDTAEGQSGAPVLVRHAGPAPG